MQKSHFDYQVIDQWALSIHSIHPAQLYVWAFKTTLKQTYDKISASTGAESGPELSESIQQPPPHTDFFLRGLTHKKSESVKTQQR